MLATIYVLYPQAVFNFSNWLFSLNEGNSYWHHEGPMKQQSKSYMNEKRSCHIIPRLKQKQTNKKKKPYFLSDFHQNINSHHCIKLSLEYRYTKSKFSPSFIFIIWEPSKHCAKEEEKLQTNSKPSPGFKHLLREKHLGWFITSLSCQYGV